MSIPQIDEMWEKYFKGWHVQLSSATQTNDSDERHSAYWLRKYAGPA